MKDFLAFLAARFSEPSTYAALAAGLGFMHMSVDPGALSMITLYGTIAAAGAGVVLAEKPGASTGEIAEDVLSKVGPLLVNTTKSTTQEPPHA